MPDPAVALDLQQVNRNLERFHQQAAAAGCVVRAHTKAHRTTELTTLQVSAGSVGAAVINARAAIGLAAAGITDVVVAWPWPEPWRWPLYVEAADRLDRFAVHVDQAETIRGLGALAVGAGTEIGVRIDVRHTGEDGVLPLARLAAETPGILLDGVTGYPAPESRADIDDRAALGRRHARMLVDLAEQIRAEGIDCQVVSAGGTPTAEAAMDVPGITEVVAGAYSTLDAGLAAIGACGLDEVAISVSAAHADLLDGCHQPWDPEAGPVLAGDRLLPAHICPLAKTLMRRGIGFTVLYDGRPVDHWQPIGTPDRA
ncbi:alanine racemase [Kribbella italica]|uniref:D-serine deaminase-like pyridoxal phosphate-dependent protein n=1 Tax=Kribbella italica TaxID=1540520 RepID=A0A7W9J2A6_9ACTN|nr:alanine racemase [Kribbella italica]MBB5834024.1 D-serine deaminase-like pyridoxal phosphate-dependent protein [Kribbella italica]